MVGFTNGSSIRLVILGGEAIRQEWGKGEVLMNVVGIFCNLG